MTDSTIVAVLLGVAAGLVLAAAVALLVRRRPEAEPGLLLVQQQLEALRAQMGQSLEGTSRAFNERAEALQTQMGDALHRVDQRLGVNLQTVGQRFSETAGMVTTVHERLKGLEEAAGRIFELGKDLTSLQDILRPPKHRGGVGEVLLENLLRDRMPVAQFEMQHRFTSGATVDAIIRLGGRFVPVDSKFPIESFTAVIRAASDDERGRARREFLRLVQGHVKTIAEKYILPEEGTYDFALMYIPAEHVYYEAVVRDDDGGLQAFAMERRVIPVSPTTFYAYLVAMAYGLKGLQVEEQAAQIRAGLAHLASDFERVREPIGKLGEQLRRAQKNYEDADRSLDRFGNRLAQVSGNPLPLAQPTALPLGENRDS
ncbi:MAG: DNA recombination protein RmuC [Armatimonadota bacterium]